MGSLQLLTIAQDSKKYGHIRILSTVLRLAPAMMLLLRKVHYSNCLYALQCRDTHAARHSVSEMARRTSYKTIMGYSVSALRSSLLGSGTCKRPNRVKAAVSSDASKSRHDLDGSLPAGMPDTSAITCAPLRVCIDRRSKLQWHNNRGPSFLPISCEGNSCSAEPQQATWNTF